MLMRTIYLADEVKRRPNLDLSSPPIPQPEP